MSHNHTQARTTVELKVPVELELELALGLALNTTIMTDNQVEPEKGKKGKADDNNNNTEENPKTGKRKLPQSLQDTPEPGVRSGKRERKPAEAFDSSVYDLLNKSKRAIQVVPGRGTHKLGDIAEIQNTIRLAHDDSLDLKNAHKLLYPVRGKTLARQMRHNLLEFSGYLPVWGEADQEKIKRDKLEEDIEVRWPCFVFGGCHVCVLFDCLLKHCLG